MSFLCLPHLQLLPPSIGQRQPLRPKASTPRPTLQVAVTTPCLQEEGIRRFLKVIETYTGGGDFFEGGDSNIYQASCLLSCTV